jgi:hypothetical protein
VHFLSDFVSYGGVALEVLTLLVLARGPLSRYFPLFLYLLTSLTLSGLIAWTYQSQGIRSQAYAETYWRAEMLEDLLLFFLLTSLTARALEGHPLRPKMNRLLLAISAVALILPLVLYSGPILGRRWCQSTAQLLNFAAGIMVLAQWTALVASRSKDRQLFLVSAGLGLTVSSAAIAFGIRKLTHQDDVLRTAADLFYRLSRIAGTCIWCWAFWPQPIRPPVPSSASAS